MAERQASLLNRLRALDEYTTSADIDLDTKGMLHVKLERLTATFREFAELNAQLEEDAADQAAAEVQAELFDGAERLYCRAKGTIMDKVDTQRADETADAAGLDHVHADAAGANLGDGGQQPAGLQLEKIRLPTFDNDRKAWSTFRDTFRAMVHEKANISNVTKLHYLHQALRGRAKEIISGFPINDANYADAWELLNVEYENKRLLIATLLRELRTLRPLTSETDSGLRHITITYRQVLRQLTVHGVDTSTWDPILTHMLVDLLDPPTYREWELREVGTEITKIDDMLKYLEARASSLNRVFASTSAASTAATPQRETGTIPKQKPKAKRRHVGVAQSTAAIEETPAACPNCKGNHRLVNCQSFLAMNPYPRFQRAQELKLCFGCLGPRHPMAECAAKICTHCDKQKRHHQLLCFIWVDKQRGGPRPTVGLVVAPAITTTSPAVNNATITECDLSSTVLLATALINIQTNDGVTCIGRALCDTGSQANIISEDCVRRLGAPRRSTATSIVPAGGGEAVSVKGVVTVTIAATSNHACAFEMKIDALIMRRVASVMPVRRIQYGGWSQRVTGALADPQFGHPGRIDLLLGAHVWSQILLPTIERNNKFSLVAQSTRLGWLIFGGVQSPTAPVLCGHVSVSEDPYIRLETAIQQFWQLESVPTRHHRSPEEQICEDVFANNHRRQSDGRYVVTIPMQIDAPALGDSRRAALDRFMALERRFNKNPELRRQYVQFMTEYLDLGHMQLAGGPPANGELVYYTPHHAAGTTKFRTVFDGSCVTTSGKSFNDIQLTGEKLQDDLSVVLLQFRRWRVAITADIAKMYRQIQVDPSQHNLQRILWRDSPDKPIEEYVLTTFTYGMRNAPISNL